MNTTADLDTMTLAELRLVARFCELPGSEFHDPDRAAEARRLIGIKTGGNVAGRAPI